MTRFGNRRVFYVVFTVFVIVGTAVALQFFGWSIVPWGKKYVPDYYFSNLHAHHKSYFPMGERLIILNGEPADSLRLGHVIGVAKATRIVEYSNAAAMERFGPTGRFGATEIVGGDAEWLTSKESTDQPNWNPAMFFMHSNVTLPDRLNPGGDAILVAGSQADTLYLGAIRYRYRQGDTLSTISLTPSRFFYVNTYKNKSSPDRELHVVRYGKEEAVYSHVDVKGAGTRAYFHDDRVVAFSRWVDNTVSAIAHRRKQTGKINDARLWMVNGTASDKLRPLSRIQTTSGTVTYLNGIQAVEKYGLKAYAGAVEVVGNALKFFTVDTIATN